MIYLEVVTTNLLATFLGLFLFQESVTENLKEVSNSDNPQHSIAFLLLTITVPSIISGIVTVSIEYIKRRKK